MRAPHMRLPCIMSKKAVGKSHIGMKALLRLQQRKNKALRACVIEGCHGHAETPDGNTGRCKRMAAGDGESGSASRHASGIVQKHVNMRAHPLSPFLFQADMSASRHTAVQSRSGQFSPFGRSGAHQNGCLESAPQPCRKPGHEALVLHENILGERLCIHCACGRYGQSSIRLTAGTGNKYPSKYLSDPFRQFVFCRF